MITRWYPVLGRNVAFVRPLRVRGRKKEKNMGKFFFSGVEWPHLPSPRPPPIPPHPSGTPSRSLRVRERKKMRKKMWKKNYFRGGLLPPPHLPPSPPSGGGVNLPWNFVFPNFVFHFFCHFSFFFALWRKETPKVSLRGRQGWEGGRVIRHAERGTARDAGPQARSRPKA